MKKLFLTSLLMLATSGALAQSENTGKWSVKPMAGLTVATMVGDDADDVKSGWGWGAGVEAEWRASEVLGLSFGAIYTQNNVKNKERLTETFDYLETRVVASVTGGQFERMSLPVMANVYIAKGLAIKAGIQPRLLLSASEKLDLDYYRWKYADGTPFDSFAVPFGSYDYSSMHVEFENHGKDNAGIRNRCNKLDVVIPVGLSYEYKNVVLDARYHFGLGDVTDDGQKALPRYLMLTLGYKFQL